MPIYEKLIAKNMAFVDTSAIYVAFGDSITAASGENSYCEKVADFFNIQLLNLGWGGADIYKILNDDQLNKLPETGVEFVTITGGNGSVVETEDIESRDRSTAIGAINYTIDLLYSKYPNVKIFMIAQTQRGVNCGPLTKWNEVYKKVADYWNIPYIDNERNCQFNKTNMLSVTYDYTHFTPEGSKRYAGGIIEEIRKSYKMI